MSPSEQLVRSLLLGAVFGDSSVLGRSIGDTERELHRFGEPDIVQRIYDRLISLRLPNSVGAGLRSVLADLMERYEGRGLPLILDTLSSDQSWRFTAPPAFPAFLFNDYPQHHDVQAGDGGPWLTDNHLHSGASISVRHLLHLLVASDRPFLPAPDANDGRPSRDRLLSLWGTDAWGRAFSLPVVAGALRSFLARIEDPDNWSLGKNVCAGKWASGTFWSDVGTAARDFISDGEFLDELFSGFGSVSPEVDPYNRFRNAVLEALQSPALERLQSVYGVLSCLSLLHCTLSSRSGEGLSRFVDRFERMGMLRDLAVGKQKSSLVTASCHSVFGDTRVIGAEFRKTVVSHGRSVEACSRSLRDSLDSHISGFADYLSGAGRELRWSAPVGFLRERRVPAFDSSRWTARTSLSSVCHLTQALEGLSSDPLALTFITGIDTAGDEHSMPNWPFLAAYDRLTSIWPRNLSFSIHAGESFGHGLEGLRHIAECLSSGTVGAIGHALALDQQASRLVTGDVWVDATYGSALLDLSWCQSVGLRADSARAIAEKLLLVGGLGAYGIDSQALLEASTKMNSLSGLVDLGIAQAEAFWIPDYLDLGQVKDVDPVRRAARLLAYRPPGKRMDVLDRKLEGDLTLGFQKFALTVEADARELVRGMVKARNAVIEACPTSNVRLAGMPSFHGSHLARLASQGIRVSVSSDDPVVFGTNVGVEFDLVAQVFGSRAAETTAQVSAETCSAPSTPWSPDALSIATMGQVSS